MSTIRKMWTAVLILSVFSVSAFAQTLPAGAEPWVALMSLQMESRESLEKQQGVEDGEESYLVTGIDTKTGAADFDYIWATVSGMLVKQTVFYKVSGTASVAEDGTLSVALSDTIRSYRPGENTARSLATYNRWTVAEGILGKSKLLKSVQETVSKAISDELAGTDYAALKEKVTGSLDTWYFAVKTMSNELQVKRFFEKNNIAGHTVTVPCEFQTVRENAEPVSSKWAFLVTGHHRYGGEVSLYTNDESWIDCSDGDQVELSGILSGYQVSGFSGAYSEDSGMRVLSLTLEEEIPAEE